jgi:hypothetical protein
MMRYLAWICCAVVITGCSKSNDQANTAADTTAASVVPAPPPPAALSLADLAGKWSVRSMAENSDSVLITYELTGTPDTSGWSIKFPNKPQPVPLHGVAVQGDSLVYHAGPYSSALRKGVTVTTDNVVRLQNDKLIGRITAHYTTPGPDSLRVLRVEGTRVP